MQQDELRDAPVGRMLKVRNPHKAEGYGVRGSWRSKRMKDVVFSSSEHKVLMVSYCDQSMSVVRRASCVVNNLF